MGPARRPIQQGQKPSSQRRPQNDLLPLGSSPILGEPSGQDDPDNPSANPWQSTNTFLQAFGVRRGWLLDMDYEEGNEGTYGVQPSEFSLQFISANQAATRSPENADSFRTHPILKILSLKILFAR